MRPVTLTGGPAGRTPNPGPDLGSPDPIDALPKTDLHIHLDGSLRPATMIELARERGIALPARTPERLAEIMCADDATDLVEYLKGFDLTLSLLQDRDAIARVAREIVEDSASDNARYVEIRYCPFLHARDELDCDEVVAAVLDGLLQGEARTGCRAQGIVAALRSLPAPHSIEMAEVAISNRGQACRGFDIAGPEAGYPVRLHLEAFRLVQEADMPITIHAGEAWGADSIRQAVEEGGARRIGHGTRLQEDPELLARVRELGVTLEACQTSNVQTRVAATHGTHPLRDLHEAGVRTSICTDNRLMSGVTLGDEYRHARDDLGLGETEIRAIARNGFEAAFLPEPERSALVAETWGSSAT